MDGARREQENIGTAEEALRVVIVEQHVEQPAILGVEQVAGVLGSAREDVADVLPLLIAQRRAPLDEECASGDVIQPRLHEEARPVVGLAYGAGQLIAHRREPGLLRRVKPSLETGATGSDVARQMPGRKPALGEGNQANPKGSRGSSEIKQGKLKNGRKFIATIEPWHGNQVVVYTESPDGGKLWDRHVIDEQGKHQRPSARRHHRAGQGLAP